LRWENQVVSCCMQFYLFYYGIQAVGGIVECGVFAMSFAHAKYARHTLGACRERVEIERVCLGIIYLEVS
jgi:hypothetical protein